MIEHVLNPRDVRSWAEGLRAGLRNLLCVESSMDRAEIIGLRAT